MASSSDDGRRASIHGGFLSKHMSARKMVRVATMP